MHDPWKYRLDRPPGAGLDNAQRRDHRALVSVVFSFFNEEPVLAELIRRTRLVFDRLVSERAIGGYELIFVNDASTDRSVEIIEREARRRADIKLVNTSRNFGVSQCVLAGMSFAEGDAVVYLDADLQDPPEVILDLVRAWQMDHQVEVVHTVRKSRAGESLLKRAVTAVGYAILRTVSTIDLPLEAGDFKLLSRRAVDELLKFQEKRPFLRGLVCWIGFKQATVYYRRQPRYAGRTKFPVLGLKVIRNFLDSAVISFSDVPLKFAALFGLLSSAVAMLYSVWIFIQWQQGSHVPGWSATMAAVLFVGGIQLLSVGILGNYISSIFLETKARPNFIVHSALASQEPPAGRAAGTTLPPRLARAFAGCVQQDNHG